MTSAQILFQIRTRGQILGTGGMTHLSQGLPSVSTTEGDVPSEEPSKGRCQETDASLCP